MINQEPSAPPTNKLHLHFTASYEGLCLGASVSVRLVIAVDNGLNIKNEILYVDTIYADPPMMLQFYFQSECTNTVFAQRNVQPKVADQVCAVGKD